MDIFLTVVFILIVAGIIGVAVIYCILEDHLPPSGENPGNLVGDAVVGYAAYQCLDD